MRKLRALLFKEFTELLRDRRTLVATVLVPGLLVPLLVGGALFFTLRGVGRDERPRVAVNEAIGDTLRAALRARGIVLVPVEGPEGARDVVRRRDADAALVLVGDTALVLADTARATAVTTEALLRWALAELRAARFAVALRRLGVNPAWADPLVLERRFVATDLGVVKALVGAMFGAMLAYIVVLFTFVGGSPAATDLVAGEKERKTLELLFTAPVSRSEVLLAKVLVVSCAALAAALVLLVSSSASLALARAHLVEPPLSVILGGTGPGLAGAALLLLLLLPLSLFAGALEVAVSAFARSAREAQTYVMPLTFLVVLAGVAAFRPDAALDPLSALIPVYGTALCAKALLVGATPTASVLASVGGNLVSAAVAFAAARALFGRESVLFRV